MKFARKKEGTWEDAGPWMSTDQKYLEGWWGRAAVSEKGGSKTLLPPIAPSNGTSITAPLYSPQHRWVYISDMRPDETWLFKQWDSREGVAKCTFHCSFHDPYHDGWTDCPGRRSVEARILLTFP